MTTVGPCEKCKKAGAYVRQCESCGSKFCTNCCSDGKCPNCSSPKMLKIIY